MLLIMQGLKLLQTNVLLGSLLVLAFVMSCNAQCHIIPTEEVQGDPPAECKDQDGIMHPTDSSWMTENCEECYCIKSGIQCCNTVAIPVRYDRINCVSIFHKNNCTYTVVDRQDPQKPCAVDAWIA